MAQGLDLKAWDNDKSPSTDSKVPDASKRTRVIGSRRIFQPRFKLQVLDSYRNDLDCRGNQRATARKYNIHRRQIQKWLQCERNLRNSVEESAKSEEASGNKDGKMDSTDSMDSALNPSAMIYTRLNDAASRPREENAVRPTLEQETKVSHRADQMGQMVQMAQIAQMAQMARLEARNLKRVAHKLYPSSQVVPCAREAREVATSGTVLGARDLSAPVAFAVDDAEKLGMEEPLDLKSGPRDLPRECLSNDTSDDMFTVQMENAQRDVAVELLSDKLNVDSNCFSKCVLLKENIERQKFCDADAVPKCLVQKYTESEGHKSRAPERGPVSGRAVIFDSESGSLPESLESPETDRVRKVPSPGLAAVLCAVPCALPCAKRTVNSDSAQSEASSDDKVPNAERASLDVSPPKKAKFECESLTSKLMKGLDERKSFSPKRKWIQESLQEMCPSALSGSARSESLPMLPVLPIKQRVKMNLRSAPGSPESVRCPKGVSPSFAIERLCCSEVKAEPEMPPLASPEESDCFGWREETCSYGNCAAVPPPVLPFPPPLILPHRVIPDLVSLHFKPEVFGPRNVPASSPSPGYEDSLLDIPLKEEKMSDSEENTDVDVLSTTPVEKKSFDFAGYGTGKRRSFSVQFKLTVLDAFYNDRDCNKNQRATARKFNINRRQVQKWLSQENDLRSEGSMKNGKYLQRQRLGTERDADGDNLDTCTQCPRHCSATQRATDDADADKRCTSTHGLDFCDKNCFQSDLKSANMYDNYLIPDNNNLVYHGWPNFNASALPVPNFHLMSSMSSWYHHFDFCREKTKIF